MMQAPNFSKDILYFIPLGGAGHFGANLNAYYYNDKILLVDFGIGFPNKQKHPNIDSYLPDIDFLKKHKDKIVGLVITHAHEDHIGAIPYLWPQLRCPIYATPFSAEFIRQKVKQTSWGHEIDLHEVALSSHLDLSPFSCDLININHSILEPNALSVKVEGYNPIFHTGDWKYDENPVIGEETDTKSQNELANQNILAAIGDSTNALRKGHSLSEQEVLKTLTSLFKKKSKRIVVTCFSSNVGRWKSIALAAKEAGRHVALVGRSLWRMYECALYAGYLKDCPKFLSAEEAAYLPNDKAVFICTGTQGEENSAIHKLAYQKHADFNLEPHDCVIFSSFNIPGNEGDIALMKEQFLKRSIEVIDSLDESCIHASGHPNQDELRNLYTRLKPEIVIPTHGETHMMYAHAKIAKDSGVKQTIVPKNGDVIAFEGMKAKIIDHIDVHLKIVDHGAIVDHDSLYIKNRRKLSVAGACVVSLVLDENNQLKAKPEISTIGILDDVEDANDIYDSLKDYIENALTPHRKEILIKEDARRAARRFFSKILNRKKPMTDVIIHKIGDKK